ncbi:MULTISPECIES: type IV pilus twitching motility protein PilT [unclassified Xanthobacter]|uniref:type IV pilus twitching motility protein PilT n=1 Tax=unclassified Xanthobacter TaxID=2623496 RepID=UPI001F209FC5|nr:MULTISPECIES: ATPase, T2SS/T4P/T4SS family [unclassified Xanthobacter]
MSKWTGVHVEQPDMPYDVGSKEEIRRLLIGCAKRGASDIYIEPGQPVLVKIDGVPAAITLRRLQLEEVRRVVVALTGSDSVEARLASAASQDCSVQYDDPLEVDDAGDPMRYRFRVNATPAFFEGGEAGLQIVLRYVRDQPPTPEEVELEPEIVAESAPHQGAVFLAGETGSGKTSTTAALKRNILAGNTHLRGNLICFEAPIEFLFSSVPSACCTLVQHEVPRHVKSFAEAVRNAMRRDPALIEIQELRDAETISAATEAASTGHPVYATVHAQSVAHVFRRLTQRFPSDMQDQGFFDIVSNTHLLVSQVLVPRMGGGRVCLREWQVMDEGVRAEVESSGPRHSYATMLKIIRRGEGGRPMCDTVARKLEEGAITVETAIMALNRYGYRAEAGRLAAPPASMIVPAGRPGHGELPT